MDADYPSLLKAADTYEQVVADSLVESLYLDCTGDFGHDPLAQAASSFAARWQDGGQELARANEGIATDVRQCVALYQFVDHAREGVFGALRGLFGGGG
jgi:hypothetical protein